MNGHEASGRSGPLALPPRFARWATPAAVAYGCVFPLVQLGIVVTYPNGSREVTWAVALVATAATAAYLPLHLRHVAWASRGARPPAGGWSWLALAVIVTAALPVAGSHWLPVYAVVVASAMLVLPWPRSVLVAGGVVAAQAPLALAVDSPLPEAASYYVHSVWWRASALFVPIWLLGAVRQLDEARRSLAEEAVVRERLRIDGELRRTVGTALEAIATRGHRATDLLGSLDPPRSTDDGAVTGDLGGAAAEVQGLVDDARRALAQARRVVTGYQRPSLAAELEAAAALLRAAGVAARVEVRGEPLPPTTDDPAVRSALRSVASDVLRDGSVRACVITVSCEAGRIRVAVRTGEATGTPADEQVKAS